MDSEIVRLVIQRKLQDGRLPHDRITRTGDGPGEGQICVACGIIVTSDQMAMEGTAPERGQRAIQFHALCFRIWDNERALGRLG